MKFLQIYTCYEPYIKHFYSSHPELTIAPFELQINELLKDGFGSLHLFAPYLTDLGYDSHILVANCSYSQLKWHHQYGTVEINENTWIQDITRQQVDLLKPDILYITDPISFDSQFIRSLSWKPKLILGWRAAGIPMKTDWSEFDLILSNWTGCWKLAPKLGARAVEYFLPAFPSSLAQETRHIQPDLDVVFCGQWTDQHQYRNQLLSTIAETLAQTQNTLGCFLHFPTTTTDVPESITRSLQPAVWGLDMHRTLVRGRISLNAAIDMAQGEGPNMRVFEATGSGAFLLTQNYCNLPQFFEPGKEVETFNDEGELIEKIYYYLDQPEKRCGIAKRGQDRCLREHSMQQRVLQLDEILRRHLSQKERASNLLESISLDAKQNQETLQQELRILEKKKQKQREKNRSLKRSLKRSRHKIKAKNRVILHLKRDLQEATSQISNIENSKLWTLYSKLSRLKRFLSRSTRQTVQSMAEYSGHSTHGSPIFQDIEHISASSHAINQTELELANSEHENSERKKTGHENSDRKNSCGS